MVVKSAKIKLSDVAQAAKVSVSTASLALANRPEIREDTRQRVIDAKKQLGYKPLRKRTSATSSTNANKPLARLGYLLVGGRLSDEAFSITAHKLQDITTNKNIRLEINAIEDSDNPDHVIAKALHFAQDLDGLILSHKISRELIHSIIRTKKPFIIIGSYKELSNDDLDMNVQSIDSDTIAMGHLAASFLIKEGHKKIAFVCEELPQGQLNYRWLLGTKAALEDHHMQMEADCIQIAGKVFTGGEPAAEAFSTMKDPPTGFVVPDIRVAAQFMVAMKLRGIEIDPKSLVLHGCEELAKRYQVEDYPRIETNNDIHQLTIEKLIENCKNPDSYSYKMLLPFGTFNM